MIDDGDEGKKQKGRYAVEVVQSELTRGSADQARHAMQYKIENSKHGQVYT